ncbi:hypothetical protein SpCBS45565_g03291 [Spizellomyces sp. 'palustris']|nr:hypothetical protein SpCBS45565_g03291 [Spizellomyces sp. 'palustris']
MTTLQSSRGSYGSASSLPLALDNKVDKRKKKFASLGNLVGSRESVTVGQIRPRVSQKHSSEVYTVKFSLDDEYVAAGLGDARIPIISVRTHETLHTLPAPLETSLPVTGLAFRPENAAYKNRNVLAASYASGHVVHYHITSGQAISTIKEADNQTNCVSYDGYGMRFATGGSDCWVRVYDGMGMKEIVKMKAGTGGIPAETAGHSNRIFSVKFHPTDPHCLISGGWDNTIQIWDIRVGHSVASIYGPHICGDALDVSEDGSRILTGSWRKDDVLQIWSLKTHSLVETLPWSVDPDNKHHTLLYSAQYSKHGNKYILAGGGGIHNQVKLYSTALKRPVGMVHSVPGTVYGVAMSANEKVVAFGGADKGVWLFDVDLNGLKDFVY